MSKESSIRTKIVFLTHRISGKAFSASEQLATCRVKTLASNILLKGEVAGYLLSNHCVVLNFRGKSYSAEGGGFCPVEVCLFRSFDGDWQLLSGLICAAAEPIRAVFPCEAHKRQMNFAH